MLLIPSEIKYYTNEYEPLDLAFCKEEYIHSRCESFYGENLNINTNRFKNDLEIITRKY